MMDPPLVLTAERGALGASVESPSRNPGPSFVPGSVEEGELTSPDELRREIKVKRDRVSRATAAILQISVSLDVSTVL